MSALTNPCLVLNANWQPINIVTVKKAIKHVWNDNAIFVCGETYQTYDWVEWSKFDASNDKHKIIGVHKEYRVPEIVVATKFGKLPTSLVTFSRTNVFKRDKYICQYCGIKPDKKSITIDHILPRASGGKSTWDNCVLACTDCNAYKADRTPEQAKMKLRSKPKRPQWQPLYSKHLGRIESWNKFVI